MAHEYDDETQSGGGFMMGLLTGTVLGAGLGMLFAPKAGSELRGQISETAISAKESASHGLRRASDTASHLAERGRDMMSKARDAVGRGTEEAKHRASEEAERMRGGSTGTTNLRTDAF
ncbi:MAG: YtxH domain-containing protein [Vicinamibacterales bacterium]